MQADMIVMYRPVRTKSLEFIEKVKTLGKKIILDIDDNLWRIPPGHPNEIEYIEYGENLRKIYALADGIWCSTDPLMDFADARCGRGVVVPNAILAQDLPDKPCPYNGIVCWRGSSANMMDICNPDAVQLFEENRDRFNRWFFWGWWPPVMRGQKIGIKKYDETVEYMAGLRHTGINTMWKPLQVNQFNDSKSNIAWIEATMAGGICVTNYAGKPGWEMAVDKFSDNADFIAHQWELSKDWVLQHYNLKKVNEVRYQHIIKTLGK